jgi:hypothetical protein
MPAEYTSRRDPRTSGVRNCRSVPVRLDIHAVVAADAGRAVCGGDGPIALPPSSIAVASRHRSADHDVKSVFPPPVWVRSRCNVRAPGSAPWPGGSRHACDCSVGRVCATPDRPGHPQKTPGGGGTTDADPAHQRRSRINREPIICEIDHHTQPGQFPIAHLDHPRHQTSPRTVRRQCASATFLSGTRVTFLSRAYTPGSRIMVYVKPKQEGWD